MINEVGVGILTVSDSCYEGQSVDSSGPNLKLMLASQLKLRNLAVSSYHEKVVPDEQQRIKDTLEVWCDKLKLALVLTTGGTGFSMRDVTPEATKQVIEREAPSLSTLMLQMSLKVTPMAVLSRSVCGMRNRSLIINLPGSKKASQECLSFLLPVIPHALDLLYDVKKNVKATHDLMQGAAETSHDDGHVCPLHSPVQSAGADDPQDVVRRHRHSPWPLMSVNEAISSILKNSEPIGMELLTYKEAHGRFLAQDVYSPDSLPPFPASIKDGYAVIASDGTGVRTVTDTSLAGAMPEVSLTSGLCMRVNTGAPVPDGADAVVQVEDTKLIEASEDGKEELKIEILKAPKPGLDIRPTGSDITKGQKVLSAGMRVKSAEVGILATVGVSSVKCYKQPRVGVMSTGNELLEPEESKLGDGKIRDSNRITLITLLSEQGIQAVDLGIAKDSIDALKALLKDSFERCDVILTTGGVSMGEKDLVKTVLINEFGAKIHFGRVMMKPGKPTTFAVIDYNGSRKLFFGLPGNPVSASVTCRLFVFPSLYKVSGDKDPLPLKWKVKLGSRVSLDPRPEYQRATLSWESNDQIPTAITTGNQISSRLLSVCSAQVLIILPPRTQELSHLEAGSVVDAMAV